MIKLTLGTDSEARKRVQLLAAFLRYIPAAAVRFALHSLAGNEKHNKGEPVHHARGKSGDHEECVLRHLMDIQDIEAYIERNGHTPEAVKMLLDEATAEFWRTGVFLQELCEKYADAPLAPAARLPGRAEINPQGDPAAPPRKLPHIVSVSADGTGTVTGFALVDGSGVPIGFHEDMTSALSALDAALGFKPINTPAEAAELAKAQGTIKVIETPIVPEFTHDKRGRQIASYGPVPAGTTEAEPFPLFADEEPLERCGVMSSTKRVCERNAGHPGLHADHVAHW